MLRNRDDHSCQLSGSNDGKSYSRKKVVTKPITEELFTEPAVEPAIAGDWRAEIEKIESFNGSPPEKADALEAVAMDYASSNSEIKEFKIYVIG